MKKYYQLKNEGLGYIERCPTYETREEAESAATSKGREYSVIERKKITPCNPSEIYLNCLTCARCSATEERREKFKREVRQLISRYPMEIRTFFPELLISVYSLK